MIHLVEKQMIWRSHWMLMSLYVSSVSVWDVLKIYTPWRQRNSFKLIPSRREKVLFICTEWADISKRNYMNRLFLVCPRPVQSPEVIMPQSPAWRPKQWQCYCYTQLFMEASALKMEGWFGFYINWWKYISNWLDIVSECSSSSITFDTKYQTFISIHDRIPENVEDAMIVEVGWFSIVNSLKIYSYIGYETF